MGKQILKFIFEIQSNAVNINKFNTVIIIEKTIIGIKNVFIRLAEGLI